MSDISNATPIADDEILYRRIPEVWYKPGVDNRVAYEAFKPHRNDTSGLSMTRASYCPMERMAPNRPGKTYFVASFRAGDLRAAGIPIEPAPLDGQPGHAEIPGMTYDLRLSDQVNDWQAMLADELAISIDGPFHT